MKKSIMYIFLILVIVIGICSISFGVRYEYNEYKFKNNAKTVNALIYQNVISNNKQTLYLKYNINGQTYEGIYATNNIKDFGSRVKIYYDVDNPLKFTLGDIKKEGYIFITLGIFLIVVSSSFVIRKRIYEKRY